MSVITRTGDDGKSRFLNKVVDKDSDLLEAVGTLDELQAIILITNYELRITNLDQIVNDLYEIMGVIAYGQFFNLQSSIFNIEKAIEKMERDLGPINKFLIFKNKKARELNLARTVCRRAERRLVSLSKVRQIDPNILIYINRLSDYLFILARQKEV